MLGAVEEIDLKSLEANEAVKFEVHVKSVSMVPNVIKVGVKPFLYDVFSMLSSLWRRARMSLLI